MSIDELIDEYDDEAESDEPSPFPAARENNSLFLRTSLNMKAVLLLANITVPRCLRTNLSAAAGLLTVNSVSRRKAIAFAAGMWYTI